MIVLVLYLHDDYYYYMTTWLLDTGRPAMKMTKKVGNNYHTVVRLAATVILILVCYNQNDKKMPRES